MRYANNRHFRRKNERSLMNKNGILLQEIYKKAEASAETAASLLSKTNDPMLQNEMTGEHMEYATFASDARRLLRSLGYQTEPIRPLSRFPARAGLQISSLLDSSPSQLSKLLIHAANANIVAITKAMNDNRSFLSADTSALGQQFINCSHRAIERLKRFL